MPTLDLYQSVTDRLIASLESGSIPWRKPWKARAADNVPSNFLSRKSYRGINEVLLMCSGYSSNQWLTYKQAQSIGAQVRKGERGSGIVFWKFSRDEDKETGERSSWAMMRSYTVFNVDQCEGIPARLPFEQPPTEFERIASAEAIASRYLESDNSPALFHGGDSAHFSPARDCVQMPYGSTFVTPEHYYAVLFHELGHSTLTAGRCDRKDALGAFGSDPYAREELVAEFCSAFLSAEAGISNELLETNQTAYLQSWIRRFKDDKKLAVIAAQRAQKAADFILQRSASQEAETAEAEAVAA